MGPVAPDLGGHARFAAEPEAVLAEQLSCQPDAARTMYPAGSSSGTRQRPDSPGGRFTVTGARTAATVRLSLSGEIDLAVRDELRRSLLAALGAASVRDVLVDLDAVTFLDCSGIGALAAGYNTAVATGRGFRLIGPRGLVRDVLILTHLLPLLAGDDEHPPAPVS